MNIKPGEIIPLEKHNKTTQFIKIVKGLGIATVGNRYYGLSDGVSITINPGMLHKIENVSPTENLKLYTIYTPPEHKDKLIQKYRL